MELTGPQKIAAILLGIDPGLASQVMKTMGDDQVELVTRAMKELDDIALGQNELKSLFRETADRMRGAGFALGDVQNLLKTVLTKAFGNQKGDEILQNAENQTLALRPFAVFEQIPSEDLAAMLMDEHPQIQGVFLAHLDPDKAGEVLCQYRDERKADIIHRIATLGRSTPEVVQKVIDVLKKKAKAHGLSTKRAEPKTWIKKAANIVNFLAGKSEGSVLDSLSSKDEEIADAIRDEMFTFDDLSKIDKKSMQKILGSIDTAVLALSLKACSSEVEENIFNNLSKRAGEMVVDERDTKGPVPISEVLEAQRQILTVVRDLIESGEVTPVGMAGEEMV